MASNLIAHVKRARDAVLGPAMPLNNPVRVAEELAMLDGLAEGRLIVGLLRGTPNEYQVYSANPVETREVTTEGMELVLKAWTEPQPFSWEGSTSVPNRLDLAAPIQQPYPQMYALGNSADTCDFAARHSSASAYPSVPSPSTVGRPPTTANGARKKAGRRTRADDLPR